MLYMCVLYARVCCTRACVVDVCVVRVCVLYIGCININESPFGVYIPGSASGQQRPGEGYRLQFECGALLVERARGPTEEEIA